MSSHWGQAASSSSPWRLWQRISPRPAVATASVPPGAWTYSPSLSRQRVPLRSPSSHVSVSFLTRMSCGCSPHLACCGYSECPW
ncbi:hypothetical protein GDO81_024642 [Engystomops pustulosus]|uniref:Uncharacterized protein n=1 Tax=Engystomops pustulosus TaxID=76066 RepID=A0AAV6YNT9_ENGPU|nr:hypothetical protein GDO81_024642 [Engystomops pustulosus]